MEGEIRELKKHRELIRSRRKKDGVITAAIVGYTNAGKSTLLNTLTDADILAENKLFATLDPTSRGFTLEDNRRILLVDTVGFIRKLPHHLIDAFKSTLEEAVVADLLIHVIDSASPHYEEQIRVVESVLSDIGAWGKPIVGVYNKCDLAEEIYPRTDYRENVIISAKKRINLDGLIRALGDAAPGKKRRVRVLIPYDRGTLVSEIHRDQKVLSEEYTGEGTEMELLAGEEMYRKLKEFVIE